MPPSKTTMLGLAACLALSITLTNAAVEECKLFKDIYTDGRDLCERMWGSAFQYVPVTNTTEYNLAYTMYFYSNINPNDAVTQQRIQLGLQNQNYSRTDVCYLKSDGVTAHKSSPSPEKDTFTECSPFRKNACCNEATVEDANTLNNLYGDTYRWDRCGPMSAACERFFVQENCFYECDPNAGLFRKYPPYLPADVTKGNEWEIYRLPIRGDYCDAFFDACRYDKFCAAGDFFACEAEYSKKGPVTGVYISPGGIAGIVIGSVIVFFLLMFLIVLICKERAGTPVFQRIATDDSRPLKPNQAAAPGQQSSAHGGNEMVTI